MVKYLWMAVVFAALGVEAQAQDYVGSDYAGSDFVGPASVGSQEPLFSYDDQERWKHGYIQVMPFYGGHHYFLPYNYHHVFGQSQTAAAWGMSPNMPYSQQFWHRYENIANSAAQQLTSTSPGSYQQPQYQPSFQTQQGSWAYSQPPVQGHQQTYPQQNLQPMTAPQLPPQQVSPVQYQTSPQPVQAGWGQRSVQPAPQQHTPLQQYLVEGPALP